MNSLSHHYNLFEATDFVLSGASAGGMGVGMNCDDVAEWLHVRSDQDTQIKFQKTQITLFILAG